MTVRVLPAAADEPVVAGTERAAGLARVWVCVVDCAVSGPGLRGAAVAITPSAASVGMTVPSLRLLDDMRTT